jgi:hypothetical protein
MHVATIRNVLGYPNIDVTVRIVGDTVHNRLLVEEAVVRRRVALRSVKILEHDLVCGHLDGDRVKGFEYFPCTGAAAVTRVYVLVSSSCLEVLKH